MKKRFINPLFGWICIGAMIIGTTDLVMKREAQADLFGGDVVVLSQILIKTIEQIQELRSIIGNTEATVSILGEMNRGVQETIRLAKTAHIPLPTQVYSHAKSIDEATRAVYDLYGELPHFTPSYERNQFESGIEGISISEDAFDYSAFLDSQGETIKAAAVVASSASASRLTAESLGVVLQAINHGNRLEAKGLEYSSTDRLRASATEAARLQSFVETEETLSRDFNEMTLSPLNSVFEGDGSQSRSQSGDLP